jgi:hypothetical protein
MGRLALLRAPAVLERLQEAARRSQRNTGSFSAWQQAFPPYLLAGLDGA